MGRTDVHTLTVNFEPASRIKQPDMQEILQASQHREPSARQVESLLGELLRCPSCDSKLSSPEAKMGRCLSCGCKLTGEQAEGHNKAFTVGI